MYIYKGKKFTRKTDDLGQRLASGFVFFCVFLFNVYIDVLIHIHIYVYEGRRFTRRNDHLGQRLASGFVIVLYFFLVYI